MTRVALEHRRPRPLPDAEDGRFALLEALLATDDLATCARLGLEWLARRHRIGTAACLARAGGAGDPLTVLAATGRRARRLALHVHAHDPLASALEASRPLPFARGARGPVEAPFLAVPMKTATGAAQGLLVLQGERRASAAVAWLARALAERFARSARPAAPLLEDVIGAVSDPILLTDLEGRLLIANPAAARLFAAREDESEGRIRAIALNNVTFSSALASLATGRDAKRELPLVDPSDGSDLLFELLASTFSPAGDLAGTCVVSILRNVTDLGRATEELRENYRKLAITQAEVRAERRRLDLIIDSVADPILVTDPAGDVVLMNAPAEKLFTIAAGSAARTRVRANDAHFSSFVSNLLFSGTDQRYKGEIALVDPASGAAMPVEAIAGKILSEHGELTAVVTILHDRTEALENARLYAQLQRAADELEAKVRAATAELAEQNELLRRQAIELEHASALKTQFLANVSHEFRTPLNSILGYTQMLLKGVSGELAPAQTRSLSRVDSNARHLLAIINEILDISRIEAGRMPLNVTRFRLPALLEEVRAELEPIVARSSIPVEFELARSLPELRTDRQKLKQIVLNLLSNALKFTHAGSVRIAARHDRRSGRVRIAVRDTGIGIAEEYHERVFEDFQQVDPSTTRPYTGTGLGLSISRRLAVMLGGDIALESGLGAGSTFTLVLPARLQKPRAKGATLS